MTGFANPQQLNINPAVLFDQLFVFGTLGNVIGRQPTWQMCVSRINVYFAEKVLVHEVAIGLRIVGSQANIFVQIKCTAQ